MMRLSLAGCSAIQKFVDMIRYVEYGRRLYEQSFGKWCDQITASGLTSKVRYEGSSLGQYMTILPCLIGYQSGVYDG